MKVIDINNENFEKEVMQSDKKVFIDFYANWCGPCRMMMPIVEELSEEVDVKFVRVNVDVNEEISRQFGIMSIPTFVVMEKGKEIDKKIGSASKEELLEMLK